MKSAIPLCGECGEVVNPVTFEGCKCPEKCGECDKVIEAIHPNQCEVCSRHFCDCNDQLTYVITGDDRPNYLSCGCCVMGLPPNIGEKK